MPTLVPASYPPSNFKASLSISSKRHSPTFSRVLSCAGPQSNDLKFILHDALDSLGINNSHAREARKGFLSQIGNLTAIERETSISINRRVDLVKTALFVASEDGSLMSHSSVPLPIDLFIDGIYDLSMGFCSTNSSSFRSSPQTLLQSLDNYLYVNQGYRRNSGENQVDPGALYLHSVLIHKTGSAAILAVIYSEILKLLRMWSLLEFDCEIFYPCDLHGLPKGYPKHKSLESDQPHIMTTQSLLEEILRDLKETFWPFQYDYSKCPFLRAADAAIHTDRFIVLAERELASAKDSEHEIMTSSHFGSMRGALAACERLIALKSDPKEFRDYSILLYHCGFYQLSLQYLKLYQERKSSLEKQSFHKPSILEDDAVKKLMTRLTLISAEEGWSKPSHLRELL